MIGSTLRAIARPTCEQVRRAANRAWWVCMGAALTAFALHGFGFRSLGVAQFFAVACMFLGLLHGEARRQSEE